MHSAWQRPVSKLKPEILFPGHSTDNYNYCEHVSLKASRASVEVKQRLIQKWPGEREFCLPQARPGRAFGGRLL